MSLYSASTQGSTPTGGNSKFYRCSIGGEWKPLDCFSRAQQRKRAKYLNDHANSGLVCREHNGEPTLELRCQGHCNLILPLHEFSKKSRSDGVNVCKTCQSWRTNLEYEEIPPAGPMHEMGPEEYATKTGVPIMRDESSMLLQDDDIDRPLAPITGTLSDEDEHRSDFLRGQNEGSSCFGSNSAARHVLGSLPPHLMTQFSAMDVSDPKAPMSAEPLADTTNTRTMSNGKPKPGRSKSAWPRKSEMRINKKDRPSNAERAFDVDTLTVGHHYQRNNYDLDDSDDELYIPSTGPNNNHTTFIRQHPMIARASRMAEEMSHLIPESSQSNATRNHHLASSGSAVVVAASSSSRISGSPSVDLLTPEPQSTWLPPHLRPPVVSRSASHNLDNQSDVGTDNTISTATTLREARARHSTNLKQPQPREQPGHAYTGWDSRGHAHSLMKKKTTDAASEASHALYTHRPLKRFDAGSTFGEIDQDASAVVSSGTFESGAWDRNKGCTADELEGGWLSEDEQ